MPTATTWTPTGARRRKITIQQQSTTKTALGFLSSTWTDVLTTWAAVSVRPVTTLASVGTSQQPIIRNSYVVNIRYVPSITILPGMRITESDGGAVYLIQSTVDPEERHRELVLFCSQVPAPAAQEE